MEAERRRRDHGPNAIPSAARRRPLLRFLAQFNNALIYFLLAGTLAASLLGHFVDSGVILAVILVNAVVGYLGFERLRLRGLSGARDEFHLAAIVQNLKTMALRLVWPPPDLAAASVA